MSYSPGPQSISMERHFQKNQEEISSDLNFIRSLVDKKLVEPIKRKIEALETDSLSPEYCFSDDSLEKDMDEDCEVNTVPRKPAKKGIGGDNQ